MADESCPNCKRPLTNGRYMVRCSRCGKAACYKVDFLGGAKPSECCAHNLWQNEACLKEGERHKFKPSSE
ncbi:hypothetical protein BAC3_00390 [uncultured bacterium]|nr:hypothetical protein BAC3_00390 [uncultured bacterium]